MARAGDIALTGNTWKPVFNATGTTYTGSSDDGAPVKAMRVVNLSTSANTAEIFAAPTMGQAVASGNPSPNAGTKLAPGESTVIYGIVAGDGSGSLRQILARSTGATLNIAPVA